MKSQAWKVRFRNRQTGQILRIRVDSAISASHAKRIARAKLVKQMPDTAPRYEPFDWTPTSS